MKKVILLLTICFTSMASFAQQATSQVRQQNKHEVSLWGTYGLSTLKYDLSYGERDFWGLGYSGGIGYNYFLNYNWSIGTGAEFSVLSSTADFANLRDNTIVAGYLSKDAPLNLAIDATNYEQTYKAFYINVPIMAKYQLDVWKQHKFYAAGGMKIGIPFKGEYSTEGTYNARGYQRAGNGSNVGSAINITKYGFGTRNVNLSGEEYDLDINYMLAVEAGMKWKLNDKLSLYTGLYADFGLVDIRKGEEGKDFFQYNTDNNYLFTNYTTNNALYSKYTPEVNGQSNTFTDRVSTVSAGLKVQLAFGFKPFNKKEKASTIVVGPADKPYEGLTAAQMEDIMDRKTKELMDFQRKEFDALRDLITKEDPELTQAIINFDLDKKQILPRMYYELDKKVALMKKYPKANLMLEGHTDDLGSDEYNYQLGLDRANAAKDYLVSKGISAGRLAVSSKGKTQPVVPNTDNSNRFKNRRVEFILQQ